MKNIVKTIGAISLISLLSYTFIFSGYKAVNSLIDDLVDDVLSFTSSFGFSISTTTFWFIIALFSFCLIVVIMSGDS